MEAERKENNDRVMVLIAESITTALGKVYSIALYKESLAVRTNKAEKATEAPRQIDVDLQTSLAAETLCRDEGAEIDPTDIAPQSKAFAPSMFTNSGNATLIAVASTQSWTELPTATATTKNTAITSIKTADIDKENFCKSDAEALRVRKKDKAARSMRKTPSPSQRAPQDEDDDIAKIYKQDIKHKKEAILTSYMRNILSKDQHYLHAR